MRIQGGLIFVVLWAILVMAGTAGAQQGVPHMAFAYPAGGKVGTTFQVTVGGQFLDGVNKVHVSGSGVKATVEEHNKPLTPGQFQLARDQLKELLEKKSAASAKPSATQPAATRPSWTEADEAKLAEVRKKLMNPPRRNVSPALAETVILQVTIEAGAEAGEREMRLATPTGLTNPMVFCVGSIGEVMEKELPRTTTRPQPCPTLPVVINGQIMPGEVDRFHFKAKKGQRMVMRLEARSLIPYLSDAVPGWIQGTLALYDPKNKQIAYEDDFRFSPDPVLCFVIPEDGEYCAEVRDSIYRGREDFVYRLTIGELPFITSIFPLGGQVGAKTRVELTGWNLPENKVVQDGKGLAAGVYPIVVGKEKLVSNTVPFAVDSLPEVMEQEGNNEIATGQKIGVGVIVNGRVKEAGDVDVFAFTGKANEVVVAEVFARRLNSPLDSYLKLTDGGGKQLAFNDDHEDKASGLNTHHADSYIRFTLPADGTYYVHLGDTQRKGGAEYGYRLQVRRPQEDFELRVVPSSISIRGGASVPLTVYALRKDSFAGSIKVSLKDSPAGFTLSGGEIPANQDQVKMTLRGSGKATEEPVKITLEGKAASLKLVREAEPAEDMMQAFFYHHLVVQKEGLAVVSGRNAGRGGGIKLLSPTPVKIPLGGTVKIKLGVPGKTPMGKVELELSEAPEGIAIQGVNAAFMETEIVLTAKEGKAKAGMKGNLIVNAYLQREAEKDKPAANNRRVLIGAVPAIAFEVVP